MNRSILLITTVVLGASLALAQTPAAAPPAAQPAGRHYGRDLKNIDTPKPEVRLKGDPDGGLTGTVSDIAVAMPRRE